MVFVTFFLNLQMHFMNKVHAKLRNYLKWTPNSCNCNFLTLSLTSSSMIYPNISYQRIYQW
jgi:hypothetical protein